MLFTCGAAACMVAANLPMLLAGRLLQGARAPVAASCWRAPSRDVYGQERVAQVVAYLTTAYVLGPMFAPAYRRSPDDAFRLARLFLLASVFGLVILAVASPCPKPARAVRGAAGRIRRVQIAARRRRFRGLHAAARTVHRRPFSPRRPRHRSSPPTFSAPRCVQRSASGSSPFRSASWPIGRIGAGRSIEFMTILGGDSRCQRRTACRLALFRWCLHGRAHIPGILQPR